MKITRILGDHLNKSVKARAKEETKVLLQLSDLFYGLRDAGMIDEIITM